MARPRKASDEEIYAAVYRAMSRLGPGELRLADIAEEAGVTPGALVQRFGSKRALLLALSRAWAGSAGELFADLRRSYDAPLACLRAYAECIAGLASSPAAFARSLAYLQIDLTDEDFRETLETHARATRAEVEGLVRDAVHRGELVPGTDRASLARTIEAVLAGSMMTWAHYREGPAADWMRADLEAVLRPYLPRPAAEVEPEDP